MSELIEKDNISHLSWSSQVFLRKPSSRVLLITIVGLSLALIILIFVSFFVKLRVSFIEPGEIVSSLGLREVRSLRSGVLIKLSKKLGDVVLENETIGSLAVGKSTLENFIKLRSPWVTFLSELEKRDGFDIKLELPATNFTEFQQSEISLSHLNIQKDFSSLKKLQNLKNKTLNLEIAPLKKRLAKIETKLIFLRKSRFKDLMGQQIENFEEESEKIKISISSQLNQLGLKIEEADQNLKKNIRDLLYRTDFVIQTHQIKSPITGVIAKLNTLESSQIEGSQIIATVVPKDALLEAQLSLPSRDMGKIRLNQKVLFKVEAYPYQQFGLFEGVITHIDRLKSAGDNQGSDYLVRASIAPPESARTPASNLPLINGMKLEGTVIVESKSAARLFWEKITGAVL